MSSLLHEKGYRSVGINQVLKKSGATSGSLYYHFPGGKQELAAAAIDFFTDEFMSNLHSLSRELDSAIDVLRRVIEAFIDDMESSQYQRGGAVTNATIELTRQVPLLQKAVSNYYTRIHDFTKELLIKNGWTKRGAEIVSYTIIATIEGALILCKAHRSTEPLHLIAEKSEQFFSERF